MTNVNDLLAIKLFEDTNCVTHICGKMWCEVTDCIYHAPIHTTGKTMANILIHYCTGTWTFHHIESMAYKNTQKNISPK